MRWNPTKENKEVYKIEEQFQKEFPKKAPVFMLSHWLLIAPIPLQNGEAGQFWISSPEPEAIISSVLG